MKSRTLWIGAALASAALTLWAMPGGKGDMNHQGCHGGARAGHEGHQAMKSDQHAHGGQAMHGGMHDATHGGLHDAGRHQHEAPAAADAPKK